MKKTVYIICCLWCLSPLPALALKVSGLYEAETIVSSQSGASRLAAIRVCLGMTLVKLTGVRQAYGEATLEPILAQAEKFVQQYRYQELEAGPAAAPKWRIIVKFDEQNLNNSLRALGIPVWGKERPSILFWLALEQSNRRLFADSLNAPELLELVQEAAQRRGVAILLPLHDLDDQAQIRPGDVWLGFQEQIIVASARYQADIVLTASISSPAPGIWESSWRSYGGDGFEHEWRADAELPDFILEEGLDAFVDTLAYEFVHTGSQTLVGEIELTVGAVDSIERYARLLDYLKSLSSVSSVNVKQVSAGEVALALSAHGGAQAVVRTINLGRILKPVERSDGYYYLLNP